MLRIPHDLDFLVSIGLLAAGLAAAATGLIADVWDLNDFWYHTVSGYVAGAFATAHVILNRARLAGYARYRWRSVVAATRSRLHGPPSPSRRASAVHPASQAVLEGSTRSPVRLGHALLSRRGLLGLGLGGVVGFLLGRGLRQPPAIPAGSDVGVIYHQWSKPGVLDALGTVADWGRPVDLYKPYPGAPTTALPPIVSGADLDRGPTTARTIVSRRSVRAYRPRPLSIDELSRLLYLTGGITAGLHGNARRAAPSSGALYPIEIYAVVHRVDGVEPGIYHYGVREHALEQIRVGDFRAQVVEQALAQEFLGECGVVLFLTLILQRMRPRYQDRSYRYGLLEAGHIGENAYLAATSMGLGACGVGAFMDDSINEMLGVDGAEEAAVYMLAAGHTA
jgi:SagB-type dehydrogenase family enzyme